MSQRDLDAVNTHRGFEVKGAKKQFHGVRNVIHQKQVQLGGFSCIYPVEDRDMMGLYHKIMPVLKLS